MNHVFINCDGHVINISNYDSDAEYFSFLKTDTCKICEIKVVDMIVRIMNKNLIDDDLFCMSERNVIKINNLYPCLSEHELEIKNILK